MRLYNNEMMAFDKLHEFICLVADTVQQAVYGGHSWTGCYQASCWLLQAIKVNSALLRPLVPMATC